MVLRDRHPAPQRQSDHYWHVLMKRAGIKDLVAHDLRHTAATYGHKFGGLSGHQVQQMLGHSSLKTTSRYLNMTDELAREGARSASAAIMRLADRV